MRKEFRYCREEKSWGEDIAQGVENSNSRVE